MAPVTAPSPDFPAIVVGPVAVRVQSATTFVPPLLLSTFLTSVKCAAWAVFVMVHVADTPAPSTNELPESVPAVQAQALAV